MIRRTSVFLTISVLLICMSSCDRPEITSSSSSSASAQIPSITASVQFDSAPASSASVISSSMESYFNLAEKHVAGDKTYYLYERKTVEIDNIKGYMLYCRDNKSGTDTLLNIAARSIKAYGDSIYALTSKSEDYRSDPEGDDTIYLIDDKGNKKFICNGNYYDSIDFALYCTNNKLYFTRSNDDAVFISDLNCVNIERIPVIIPEQQEIFTELGKTIKGDFFTEYRIDKLEGDTLLFYYSVLNDLMQQLFYGSYSISVSDHHVVKHFSSYQDSERP